MKHSASSTLFLLSTTTTAAAIFTVSLLLPLLLQRGGVQAADSLARDKCRELHHVEVDGTSTYSNNNCLLRCVIHGKPADHFMNEGFPCPLAEAGVCRGGQCVPKQPGPGNLKLGSLEIELLNATFPTGLKTPYVNVCLMNSTNHQTLPLTDMSTCSAHCKVNFVASSQNGSPTWAAANGTADRCAGLFVEHAGVFLEAKETKGEVFLGGISLTVPQLLSHGDNSKPLHLELTGSTASPELKNIFLNTKITWTAKRS